MDFIKSLFTWWNSQTLNTRIYTWRNGVKVGEDEQGNCYYETRDARRRWVIYNGEAEASRVPVDWHGWLHHTFKESPIDKPFMKKSWEKPHQENLTGTSMAYVPSGSLSRTGNTKPEVDYEAWKPE